MAGHVDRVQRRPLDSVPPQVGWNDASTGCDLSVGESPILNLTAARGDCRGRPPRSHYFCCSDIELLFLATAAQLGGIVTFGLLLWRGGRPAASYLLRHQPVADGNVSPVLMSIVLGLLFFCAMCTYALGIFAIFGGFATGLLFHENRAFVEAWRRQVGQFVLVFFLPIFFTHSGLRTNVLGLATVVDWEWCMIILSVTCVSKIVPVYFAARHARLLHSDAISCGVLINSRALLELIVLNVAMNLASFRNLFSQ